MQWQRKLEKGATPSKTHRFCLICLLNMDNFATLLDLFLSLFSFLSLFFFFTKILGGMPSLAENCRGIHPPLPSPVYVCNMSSYHKTRTNKTYKLRFVENVNNYIHTFKF